MKRVSRVAALFAAFLILLSALSSCAGGDALSYGSQSVSRRLFAYTLSLTKTQVLSGLSSSSSSLQDDPAIWEAEISEGQTYGDYVWQNTVQSLKLLLFYCDYAHTRGITLTETEEAEVKEKVDKIVSYFDSRQEFDSYMGTYDVDYALLHEYYEKNALSNAGMRAYFSTAGTSLTKADCKAYFLENYRSCLFVYYNLKDQSLPNGKTVPLSETESAQKRARAEDALAAVRAGAPLSDFLSESDESSFPDGTPKTFTRESLASDALFDALSGLTEGEVSVVEADQGLYLVEPFALEDDAFDAELEDIYVTLMTARETEILTNEADAFMQNEGVLASFSVKDLAIFAY